ncbi:FecR family protein [Chitinophaga sp. CF118]|uniref:FecR family protein n=1 Tax=Chitinophaga sp. CF118 TaxID=1884367 RepID=UPI0008E8BAEB|nr:FecR domain-containing protein [Chitinophaga sp. CF118]SFE05930.1 FecR family protein [Chitinophaga sp. CF118]
MNNDKYLQYSLQDFLEDDAFIKWVSGKEQDVATAQFWSDFSSLYPSAATNFDFAVNVIRTYRAQEFWDNKNNKAHLLERISATIEEKNSHQPVRLRWLNSWLKAAVIALLITVGGYYLINQFAKSAQEIVATGYGEKRTITLPDHSVVTLNAASSVTYNREWNTTEPREVWVEGEALFDVKHLNKDTSHITAGQKFIVHTNGITVEVLGTTFNIRSRHGKTNVGLITGKIKVGYNEGAAAKPHTVVMLPGDYIEYADNQLLLTKKLDKPEKIKRWTQTQLAFTDATLEEIIETLQDNYGYVIKVKEQSLRKLKIEGDINVTNVEELLTVITTTLNVKINQPSDKELVISSVK